MKKAIGFTIIFTLLLFVYQFVVIFLENGHEITYTIETKNNSYEIKESYVKHKDIDGYYITIKKDNNTFNFFLKNQYNKQKKIVKNIKEFEKDGYYCIYPISMKQDDNIDIVCSYNNQQYSAAYVKTKINIDSFINEYEDVNKYKIDNKKAPSVSNYYYDNNIDKNEYIALYKYNSFDIYNNTSVKRVSMYFKDVYVNNLGAYLDYYYLSPNSNDSTTDEYLLVNLKDATSRVIYLDRKFSSNSYNLGVVDHKLYVFDLDNKIEYEFDTYGEYKIVGDPKKGYKFYENNRWESVPVTKFTESKSVFETNVDVPFKYDEIYDAIEFYYVVKSDVLYKVYKNDLNNMIYLSNIGKHTNVKVYKNNLYYLKDGYIYKYNKYGNKPIAYDNELKFNNNKIMYYVYVD